VKNKIAVTPLRSGCDDEAEPCTLLTLIEDKELAREHEKMAREEDKKDKELAREQNKKMLDVMFALHSSAAKSPK
jgi:hypothetical protein